MIEHIVGNPDSLEQYTQQTQATLGPLRESLFNYWLALKAFLSAKPNDFGDGSVPVRSASLNQNIESLEEFDAKPAAFAFALRGLDSLVPDKPGDRGRLHNFNP